MRLYLVAYFGLLIGAGIALWRAGVLDRIPARWIVIAAVIAAGLGTLLAIVSRNTAIKTHE